MQQDKKTETILQQLESQQLPDLSRMDAHWQQLQAMLQPAAAAPAKPWLKPWTILAACLLLCSLTFVLLTKTGSKSSNDDPATAKAPAAAAPDTMPVARIITKDDTLKLVYPPAMLQPPPILRLSGSKIAAQPRRTDTVYFNLNFIDCKVSGTAAGPAAMPAPERQQRLLQLFAQLQKQAEELVIDNRLDTLLTCPEGTTLLIPAGSLGGSAKVTLQVKEFYTKPDMVLNRLTTTSNGQQLVTGGMLHISATADGSPVDIMPGSSIRVFMTSTSDDMQQMQLFTGEKVTSRKPSATARFNEKMEDVSQGAVSGYINWIPSGQPFFRPELRTEAKVLDLRNTPLRTRETKRGTAAIFVQDAKAELSKNELKAKLKELYGYAKVKLKKRSSRTDRRRGYQSEPLGDSAWIAEADAKRYGLPYSETRVLQPGSTTFLIPAGDRLLVPTTALLLKVKNRYGVDIRSLGWINCDYFYNDRREKVEYTVQLGDTASNYHTQLVFSSMNAMMYGYMSGTQVVFPNVPADEPVKVVSIGINRRGQPVYAVHEGYTSRRVPETLQYQPADAAALPKALSNIDK